MLPKQRAQVPFLVRELRFLCYLPKKKKKKKA